MEPPIRPLIASGHESPAPRYPRGRRHPLAAILALMGVAMRCGYRSDRASAAWGRCYGQRLAHALGVTQAKPPCAATLSPVRRPWEGCLVEAALGAWADRVLTARPPAPGEPEALASEGKTRRGSRTQGAPAAPLLSVRRQRVGLTRWQPAVAAKPKEIPGRADVWRPLVVDGRGITVEAVRTQRAIAPHRVEGSGDYVMVVKGTPPQRYHALPLRFQDVDPVAAPRAAAETGDVGPGRSTPRRLTASTALAGDTDWPGLAQGFQRERHGTLQASRVQRAAVVSGVTSLPPAQAGPERLLGVVRQPWPIAHKVHGGREVTFDEARSHGRSGRLPQVMAAFRHTALG